MSQIYSKTPKGQEEIKTRTGGLTQRMRQILIFIDGKRSRDDLHDMLKGDDIDELLHSLVEQGFATITGSDGAAAPRPAAPAATTAAPAPAAQKVAPKAADTPKLTPAELEKKLREEEEQAQLAMARSFMGRMS